VINLPGIQQKWLIRGDESTTNLTFQGRGAIHRSSSFLR
jgi:hypothetical protein